MMGFYEMEDLWEGMELEVLFKNTEDAAVWSNSYVPVRIEREYPGWFQCTVLPHKNKHGVSESKEYTMTISKASQSDYLLRPIF